MPKRKIIKKIMKQRQSQNLVINFFNKKNKNRIVQEKNRKLPQTITTYPVFQPTSFQLPFYQNQNQITQAPTVLQNIPVSIKESIPIVIDNPTNSQENIIVTKKKTRNLTGEELRSLAEKKDLGKINRDRLMIRNPYTKRDILKGGTTHKKLIKEGKMNSSDIMF